MNNNTAVSKKKWFAKVLPTKTGLSYEIPGYKGEILITTENPNFSLPKGRWNTLRDALQVEAEAILGSEETPKMTSAGRDELLLVILSALSSGPQKYDGLIALAESLITEYYDMSYTATKKKIERTIG